MTVQILVRTSQRMDILYPKCYYFGRGTTPARGVFLFMQNSADILTQLRGFQAGRKKPQDILAEEETKLGLPSAQQRLVGLRSAIGNTENLLRNVDPSVTGRTSGTFTTEAQRQRLVAKEREPISEQLREESRALEGETANTSDLSGRALKAAQLGISDLDSQENSLRALYGSLYQREQDEAARVEREKAARAAQASQNAYMEYLNNLGNNQSGVGGNRPPLNELFGGEGISGIFKGLGEQATKLIPDAQPSGKEGSVANSPLPLPPGLQSYLQSLQPPTPLYSGFGSNIRGIFKSARGINT